ncbi:MAG: hypothetical protein V8S36_06325 [Lachnospiraceae bacterium]
MDLMKGSTSFRSLRKKYDDFSAPSVEVTVGSTKLVSGAGADIFDLELELTSGFEASGCVLHLTVRMMRKIQILRNLQTRSRSGNR